MWKVSSSWRHETEGQFAGVEGNAGVGRPCGSVGHGAHVAGVVGERNRIVFGGNQIHAHNARVGGGQSEAVHHLREHLRCGTGADHLGEKAHGHVAADCGRIVVAAHEAARFGF